jgi:hypothetical protein
MQNKEASISGSHKVTSIHSILRTFLHPFDVLLAGLFTHSRSLMHEPLRSASCKAQAHVVLLCIMKNSSTTIVTLAVTSLCDDGATLLQVRVQAGATVQEVVEALRPHGLTLQNFASVREQQIGGFIQVSAHGTGSALPPVDEQVVSLRLVSSGSGFPVDVVKGKDAVFDWVKVGLGSMGVVTEVTLQCVDAHKLIEKTFVATRDEVRRSHKTCVQFSSDVASCTVNEAQP